MMRSASEISSTACLLLELLQGPALTGRHLFARKITVQYPGGEDAAVAALPRPARAAPLSERRRALHRLQAVRGGVPGARDHHRVRAARRRHAPHDALRHRPLQVHLLRLLRGELPGRLDRRDAHPRVPRREARRAHLHQGQCCSRSATATRPRSPRDRAAGRAVPLRHDDMTFAAVTASTLFARDPGRSRRSRVDHRAQPGARGAVPRAARSSPRRRIWLLLQAEFLAIALVLVYVGAVMVLFLFVVMMLDINSRSCARASRSYLPLGVAGRRARGASRWRS